MTSFAYDRSGTFDTAGHLTQVFYPYFYEQLLYLDLPLLVALTLRNILTLVLFGWAVSAVLGMTRPFAHHEAIADTDAWLPTAWPFTNRTERAPHAGQDTTSYEDTTAL